MCFIDGPLVIDRLADLLLAGAVMNQALQCHESHIPFVLQVSKTKLLIFLLLVGSF